MDCPRRRAAATMIAALLGAGGLAAQDPAVTPKIMPPKITAPGTPLPPTGTPVGTPIPGGIPAGTLVNSIPVSSGPILMSDRNFPAPLPTIPVAPSPYYGYYPTQWRPFPESPFPPGGQPLPSFAPGLGSTELPPPLLKAPTPNPLPTAVQTPLKSNLQPAGGPEPVAALPPLFASENVKGPELPFAPPSPKPAATMGRPRLSSAPEPIPQPAPLPNLIPASATEIFFSAAPVVPAVAVEQPLTVRPPVPPSRPHVNPTGR